MSKKTNKGFPHDATPDLHLHQGALGSSISVVKVQPTDGVSPLRRGGQNDPERNTQED